MTAGLYRYDLRRDLDPALLGLDLGCLGWIMLNPSTADATQDDPTIRRVMAFSRSWGASRLRVANLYPLRATDPAALWAAPEALRLGNAEHADAAIADLCRSSAAVVLAWGSHGSRCRERVQAVMALAHETQVPLLHLGRTREGHPRHPLYVRGDTPLVSALPEVTP